MFLQVGKELLCANDFVIVHNTLTDFRKDLIVANDVGSQWFQLFMVFLVSENTYPDFFARAFWKDASTSYILISPSGVHSKLDDSFNSFRELPFSRYFLYLFEPHFRPENLCLKVLFLSLRILTLHWRPTTTTRPLRPVKLSNSFGVTETGFLLYLIRPILPQSSIDPSRFAKDSTTLDFYE